MSRSVNLVCVHPSLKRAIWPHVVDRLKAAYLKTDLAHTADLARDVLEGHGDLWLATVGGEIEAAAVTMLARTDRHIVCTITAIGGKNMGHWLALLAKIEAWAKREGAAKMRIVGRRGWAAVLDDYKVTNVVLERAL